MKHKIVLYLAFCSFLSMKVFAATTAFVGCLEYQFEGNSAYIIGYDVNTIPETLVIPQTIEYSGLSYNVTKIKNFALEGCSKIKKLLMNHRLSSIGSSAFQGCSNLETVDISADYLYDSAFRSCTSLKMATILANDIRSFAFSGCASLESLTLNGVVDIYDDAFSNCTNLKWIDFGNSLKRIGSNAFGNCSSLTYLVFPSSLNIICPRTVYNTDGGVWGYRHTPWGESSERYYGQYGFDLEKYYLKDTYAAFSGCNLIQSVIYLGSNVSTGLNNVNRYYIKDLVTWSSTEFVYTGLAPSPTYTYSLPAGLRPINTSELSALEKNVGSYSTKVPITFVNDDMSFNVDIPYNYTINPAKLTAKVKDASRLYGDSNPQFSSDYSGFVNNEDASVITSHGTYTTAATGKSDVGTYSIKQSGATAQNYTFEYEEGTLTVDKAPLTISANNKSMTYGNSIPTLDAKYEGLKNNETQPTWTTPPVFATNAKQTSKVGTYPITISNAVAKNYEVTINNGTLTIEKANLTVRANNSSRLYGDANPEFSLTYTGLKNSETVPEWEKAPTIETTATTQSAVGSYNISIKDAVATNYNINAIDGTLTVSKASLQVTPKNETRAYGEENPQFTLSYVGLKNNETIPEWESEPVFKTQATKTSSVGDYSIQVASAEARNYTLDKKIGILTITKAPLTVGINNCSRKYGEMNPSFSLYYSGLKNGETTTQWTEMPIISTEAKATSDVGEYRIVGTGGVMRNYEVTDFMPGVLTVTPAPLTIKANNANRLYYDGDPKFTYYCSGFVGNDDASVLYAKPIITTTATIKSKSGIYPLEISGAEAKNYNIDYVKGQLAVTKRNLNVTTKNYTRTYKDQNPIFELTYKGFVNNENENVLISKPQATTLADAYSDAGIYDIMIGNGVAENYDFTYQGGKLTIEKAYQTLTWNQELTDLKQNDQVELTANATSGLDVSYTVEVSSICSIYRIGNKQYLNCTGEGETTIVAIQQGNKNYWETSKTYKQVVIKSSTSTNPTNGNTLDGHEYVDLGLPSGKCWATVNYGASYPEEYGSYVGWSSYGIISSNWGSGWTTPSVDDIRELENNCTWTWGSINGHYGYTVKGRNGNSIFLPASGFKMMGQSSAKKVGEWVYYWSSTQSNNMAYAIGNSSSNVQIVLQETEYTNLPIRPITKNRQAKEFFKLNYMVDGYVYKTLELSEGTTIIPEPAPTKDGYTFSGWSDIPATMPAHDITVNGTFIINKYRLSFIVDNKELSVMNMEYGATITPPTTDNKGNTISWYTYPETMPAHDLVVYGMVVKEPEPEVFVWLTVNDCQSGYTKIKVKQGAEQTLNIAAEEGWKISNIFMDGRYVTARLAEDGTFVTPAINSDASIIIVYEETVPSGVRATRSQAVVKVVSDGVIISNAEPDSQCVVYSASGRQVVNTVISEGTRKIVLPQGQVYVLTIDGRTLKFAL